MKYKLLGKSGLRVSELCLGTMTFGSDWGYGADMEESRKIFNTYIEAGGNFIDTANRYTEGTSERYVGEFIQAEREKLVVATKYSLYNRMGDPNSAGNHRKNMRQSVDGSLKRLKTDYVDLLYLHAWDFMTPEEEILRGLDDLVSAGKVLYIGISDTPAWVISRCNAIAELRGWTSFIGLQIEYSLLQRTVERDLLPMAKSLDIGITAWAPLAGGALTGKYLKDISDGRRLKPESARLNDKNTEIVKAVKEIADEAGCSPVHVAVNWLRQQSQVVIPVVGARTENQMRENVAALRFRLTGDQLYRLNDASRIDLGFPHDFLASDPVKNVLYAGSIGKIENHRK
ncbi:MAG: aldo/keto reductase [Cytophagaceae bacterium]